MNIRSIFLRLHHLFRKDQLDRDVNDELASHLEMHIADNLRAGMSPEEARRDALLKLGGLQQTKESVRDTRGFPLLEALLQDLRFALRMLRKSPGFTAVAVLTLALGIGANTAIFSVANAVLLRSLPYKDSDHLVIVWEQNPSRGWTTNIVSAANFLDWRRQNTVFTGLAAVDATSFNLAGADEPIEIGGEHVTANLFSLLGVQPIRGRGFQPEEDDPGSTPVAIVS